MFQSSFHNCSILHTDGDPSKYLAMWQFNTSDFFKMGQTELVWSILLILAKFCKTWNEKYKNDYRKQISKQMDKSFPKIQLNFSSRK